MSNKILIKDRIYGQFTIDSPLLIELINSSPVQRLKGIAQFGIPDEFYFFKNFSRFEHSIGVMLLLKKFGASELEQIAGLLHDVSHTAFSHTIDWVVGEGGDEDYQDKMHKNYLTSSGIADILTKYKVNPKVMANYKNFTLLEKPIPHLCADRIDYSLRESTAVIAKNCIRGLIVKNNKFVFRGKKTAQLFANNFIEKQTSHWASFEAVSRYRIFADVLKRAVDLKIVAFDDFWKNDEFVVKKLTRSSDAYILNTLKVLRRKSLKSLPPSKTVVYKKFRYVDPEFLDKGGMVKRLSREDKKFANILDKALKENRKGITIPLISNVKTQNI